MYEESKVQVKNTNLDSDHFSESKHQLKIEGVFTGLSFESLIRSFHPATNGSFVAQISYEEMQHYSAAGEVLGVLDVKRGIFSVFMASPSTVMILTGSPLEQDKNHEIIQWDLDNYQTTSMSFTRSFDFTWFAAVFSETKLFCVGEMNMNEEYYKKGKYVPEIFGLLYFKYPLKEPKSAETHQKVFHSNKFKPSYEQMSKQLKMVKMNNRSMIGWVSKELTPNQNGIEFYVYNLERGDETWRTIKIKPELNIDWKLCSVRIEDIYEFKPSSIFIKLGVEPDGEKLGQRLLDEEEILYSYQKQYDLVLDSKTEEVRLAKFSDPQPHFVQFIGQYRYLTTKKQIRPYIQKARKIRQKNMLSQDPYDQKYCMQDKYYCQWLRSQKHQRLLPIYYIDPNLEEVITKEDRQFDIVGSHSRDPKRSKIFPVTYNSRMFIEYFEERGNCFKMHVRVRKVKQLLYPPELIAVHMLCEMVKEADDDLLSGVGILVTGKRENEEEWNWSQQ